MPENQILTLLYHKNLCVDSRDGTVRGEKNSH